MTIKPPPYFNRALNYEEFEQLCHDGGIDPSDAIFIEKPEDALTVSPDALPVFCSRLVNERTMKARGFKGRDGR